MLELPESITCVPTDNDGGCGAVGVLAAVGLGVFVSLGVFVARGVLVSFGVLVERAVFVGRNVVVGLAASVARSSACAVDVAFASGVESEIKLNRQHAKQRNTKTPAMINKTVGGFFFSDSASTFIISFLSYTFLRYYDRTASYPTASHGLRSTKLACRPTVGFSRQAGLQWAALDRITHNNETFIEFEPR